MTNRIEFRTADFVIIKLVKTKKKFLKKEFFFFPLQNFADAN